MVGATDIEAMLQVVLIVPLIMMCDKEETSEAPPSTVRVDDCSAVPEISEPKFFSELSVGRVSHASKYQDSKWPPT